MSFDYASLANKSVLSLQPYVAGKVIDAVKQELGLSHITKLASNENPAGPSPLAIAAIKKFASSVALYPDDNALSLRRAIANHWHISSDNVAVGNGSNSLLDAVGRLFLNKSTSAVYSEHSFLLYEHAVVLADSKPLVAPMTESYACDLDRMLSLVQDDTRLVFLANPNNPTGRVLSHDELSAFMCALPKQCLLVLDEAYAEFVDAPSFVRSADLLANHDNLLVLRTFSKAYGLAGLRVGYCIANPSLIELLNRIRLPFNVSKLAQEAAIAALLDQAYVRATCAANIAGLEQLRLGLIELGFEVLDSSANFLCFKAGSQAIGLADYLLKSGIIVRSIAEYKMPNYLRVSVGSEAQNTEFLNALAVWQPS